MHRLASPAKFELAKKLVNINIGRKLNFNKYNMSNMEITVIISVSKTIIGDRDWRIMRKFIKKLALRVLKK